MNSETLYDTSESTISPKMYNEYLLGFIIDEVHKSGFVGNDAVSGGHE